MVPRLFSIRPTLVMKGRTNHGLRGLSGKPLHPPLTDIPTAAYALTMIFDCIAFFAGPDSELGRNMFRAATYVLIAGAVVSVATALTGFLDWRAQAVRGSQAWRTANWHMAVMGTVTLLVLLDIIVRTSQDSMVPTVAVLVLSVLVGSLVMFGAAYGGTLVYEYGFSVEPSRNGAAWRPSEHDVLPGAAQEDAPRTDTGRSVDESRSNQSG